MHLGEGGGYYYTYFIIYIIWSWLTMVYIESDIRSADMLLNFK